MKSTIIHRKAPGTHKPLVGGSYLPATTNLYSNINPKQFVVESVSHQVNSRKYPRRSLCAIDSKILLETTAIITCNENPVIATPSAVPLAGGCSQSKATIRKIETPTASAYTRTLVRMA